MINIKRNPGMIGMLVAGSLLLSCRNADNTNGQTVQPVNVRIEVVKPETMVDAIQVAGTVKAF